jgi:hypothetical protein
LRALAPGSVLSCLDAVSNPTVEASCEKSLFANAEAAAAAVAYVDAKLTLLADAADFATRDPGYAPKFQRLRRALEADRYGVVAQALSARGCTAEACPALKLFLDPRHVLVNLAGRTFEANVALNSPLWRPEAAALAAAPASSIPSASAPPASTPPIPGLARATAPSKFEFPSAASIPPISIMNAEPPLSKQEQAAIATPPAVLPPVYTQQQPQQPGQQQPQPQRRPAQTLAAPRDIVPDHVSPQPGPVAPPAR